MIRSGCVATALGLSVLALSTVDIAHAHYEPCTAINGHDTCPQAESCSRTDGGTGLCLPPPCNVDIDCTLDPLRRCDKATSVCIQCYADSECTTAPRKTCELDPRSPQSNRCVECGLVRPNACNGAVAGHLCVPGTGLCGCETNADCNEGSFCRRTECVARPPLSDSGVVSSSDGSINGSTSGASGSQASTPFPFAAGGSSCSVTHSTDNVFAGVAVFVALLLRSRRSRRACPFPSSTSRTL